MPDTLVREGDRCPAEGCHWVVVWCDCEEGVASSGDERGHLICLGCGQDADQAEPNASDPCDCGEHQPAPGEANYRP